METIRLKTKNFNTTFEHNSPKDFLVSQWQSTEKNLIYVIYRWFVACFFVMSVVTSIFFAILRNEFKVYFIYLTNWNLCLTMLVTCMSARLTTMLYRDKLDLKESMTPQLKVLWCLSTSTTMYAILITIVYWTLLFKTDRNVVDFNNILVHATNSIVLVVDLFIVKHPPRFGLYLYPLKFGLVYLSFSFVYPYFGGLNKYNENFIYSILNWSEKPTKAVIVGIAITISGAIIHCIISFIHKARSFVYDHIMSSLNAKKSKDDIFYLTV